MFLVLLTGRICFIQLLHSRMVLCRGLTCLFINGNVSSEQVFIVDKTGLSPERDTTAVKNRRVITKAGKEMTSPRLGFK